MKCVQLVGPAVGQNGQYTFYRSFKFCQPEQLANEILNGKSQGSIKSSRILQIGQFFFVRTSPADDPCIGELQLLWQDSQSNQSLASVRLYFLPEQTPDGRKNQHGEHEVLAASEKVVLRLEVLGQWITDQVDWTHGLLAPVVEAEPSPDSKTSIPGGYPQNGLVTNGSSNPESNHKHHNGISNNPKAELQISKKDVEEKLKQMDLSEEIESASVIVLSYTHYCRYRALMLRLGNQCDKWLRTELVRALGGLTVTSRNTRVLFCRDTFDHEGLFNDFNNCDHLAPNVKGRSKKKRLKNIVPAVVVRSQSPGSESNTSEEIKSPVKIPADLPVNEVSNGKKLLCGDEEKDFLDKLYKFMQDRDTPINRVPHLGFKQIDMYRFYKFAQKLGGYHKVTSNKMWKHVYDEMGGNPGSTSAATCTRRHYERLLLPFENHLNGVDYKTPLPKKHRKKDFDGNSNDDMLDDGDEEDESMSGEGDAFDQSESRDNLTPEIPEPAVSPVVTPLTAPVVPPLAPSVVPPLAPSVVPPLVAPVVTPVTATAVPPVIVPPLIEPPLIEPQVEPSTVVIKEEPNSILIVPEVPEVKEFPKPIEIIEDKDIEILEIPVVKSEPFKIEVKEEIKVPRVPIFIPQIPKVIPEIKDFLKIEPKVEQRLEKPFEESVITSDDEGNIPLAFLNKVANLTKSPIVKIEPSPNTGTPKLEVPSVQGGQQDSEVEILEAKEAEDLKTAESLASPTSGPKKQRVRDNVFSEKERQWNEIRKKNAMARTWVKKGSKSASTSPLHRHFGPSTIPDQPGDSANMVCSPALPPAQQANKTPPRHHTLFSHHPHKPIIPPPKPPTNVLPPPSNDPRIGKPSLHHRLPPSMNLLESSKPLPIANPPPSSCGYITCGVRNPNCYGSSCGDNVNNVVNQVVKQRPTKANYHHHQHPSIMDKTSYRSAIYAHPAKELSNGRINSGHSRSLSPTNQPRPSVIQHTEKIQSPPPPGGSQPLPAHMSSSKSLPGIHHQNLASSSRSRSLYPSSQGSNSFSGMKSRPYDVASLRTSSASSRSVNNHLKAPDIYAKPDISPATPTSRKEMPGLLPIRALPDSFFQLPSKQANLVKSLSYAKDRSSRDGSYLRRPESVSVAIPNNLPGYQRPIPVPMAVAPSTPVYPRGVCAKVPDSDPCEAGVLDLSVKRKSASSNGDAIREWPVYEEIPLAEGECLDLSLKKRRVEPLPLTTLTDEARGIENVTPPSPGGRITSDPAALQDRVSMLSPLKTPITSLNLTRSISAEKTQPHSVRRTENRSPPMLIPLNETRTPYAIESDLIAQQQRHIQRKANEYAAYQQYPNGHHQASPGYPSNNWSLSQSLIHQPTPQRSNPPLPISDPRTPSENLAAYSELVERGLLTGQIPFSLASHLYPLMYKDTPHYQSFSK